MSTEIRRARFNRARSLPSSLFGDSEHPGNIRRQSNTSAISCRFQHLRSGGVSEASRFASPSRANRDGSLTFADRFRPVDIVPDLEGNLLISDDESGSIYNLTFVQ